VLNKIDIYIYIKISVSFLIVKNYCRQPKSSPTCFCPLDASGDANSAYSCRSLYGSSRTARYLDGDNSFSVPVVPLLLLCYVSRALLLPLSPAPLRIPPFSLFRRATTISLTALPPVRFRHDVNPRARLCAYVFYCCEPPTFFLSVFLFFSTFSQLHG